MRTVRDGDGNRYFLLKESSDASLVQDPETGERTHVPTDDLTAVDESPLQLSARAVPDDVRTVLTAVPDERALGLLVELDARGPLGVRALLDSYDLCESDLHGLLAEFRAAGLVDECTVAGERGYEITETASEALRHLTD